MADFNIRKMHRKGYLRAILQLGMRSLSFLRNIHKSQWLCFEHFSTNSIAYQWFDRPLITNVCALSLTPPICVSSRETSPILEICRFILGNKWVNNWEKHQSWSAILAVNPILRGIPLNSVGNPAHDSVRKIKCSIPGYMYQIKPRFLNITTMISKNWIYALAGLYFMSLQKFYRFCYQQKLTEIQFQWSIEWHSCFLSVSLSVWAVVLPDWTFHCTINHGAPWEMIHFSWDLFEKSISLINEYSA